MSNNTINNTSLSEKLKVNSIERLVQEHAIYKAFFEAFKDRPRNAPGNTYQRAILKANAFDVVERIERLNSLGEPYYNPAWADADKILFTIDTGAIDSDS